MLSSALSRRSLMSRSVVHRVSKAWLTTDPDSPGMFDKVAFIGSGRMAQAMIEPLIKQGYQPADKVAIYDVSNESMQMVKSKFPDVQTTQSITEAVTDADLIVCAVKPQNITETFFNQFPKEKLREDTTFLSILAGIPVKEFMPSGVQKIVRAMPNTPATIGEGVTVWCCTPNLTSQERDGVQKVLGTFGDAVSTRYYYL